MQYEYDYFISYAHDDNESEDGKSGFVDEFVKKLENSEEHRKMFGGKVSVFFDKDEIPSMSVWDLRIRSKLALSRFFVVLLSPSYFQSEYCAREFDWWMQHEMHRRLLGEATAPMKIVTVEEIDEKNPAAPAISDDLKLKFPNWMKLLRQIQSGPDFDMRNLYRAKIDETLRALRRETKDKVFKQNIAEESPTNTGRYPDYNHNFVGRRDELSSLRRSLSTKSSVAISAVNGLGGIGKTELAITYGHTFAWDYGLGRVFAKCENQTSLDNVLLSCGIAEMYKLNLKGTNEQKISQLYAALTDKRKAIEKRNDENNIDKTLGTHLLLILDNVNQMDLISLEQLRKLPSYFHVIITTRESTSKLSHIDTESLDRLSEDESVELLSNLYSFKDNNEALAARKIAKLLDGFTLAVEITGSYLRQYEKDNATYQEQYEFLSKNLPEGIKEMVNDGPALQQHQTECISVVLQPTLTALANNSLKALKFASRMSPDAVALGWLPELVCVDDNEGKMIRRQLTGYNLLTPLQGERNIARIHRLVAESLDISEEMRKNIINNIRTKCNNLLKKDEQFWSVPENIWNITPVSEFLKLLAEKLLVKLKTVESSVEQIDWSLTWMMSTAGNIFKSLDKINEAYEVFHLCYIICKERGASFPDNKDVLHDYCSSYDSLQTMQTLFARLSEKEKAAGNALAAQENLEKSQKISQEIQDDFQEFRQKLIENIPKDEAALQEMIASYNNLGDLEKAAGNAEAARAWYKKARDIRQKIDDAASKNARASKMSYHFDYFISYARADNQSEDGQTGFVDRFVEKLIKSEKQRQMFGGEINVFFDKSEIHSMSEWDNHIRSSLAYSRFLIVIISPNYFKSEYCAREFDWWIQHEMHRRTLGESIIPILIDSVKDLYDSNKTPLLPIPQDLQAKHPNWGTLLQKILSSQDSYTHSFDLSKIDEALQSVSQSIKDKVYKQSLADNSPSNALYPRYNKNFVGRRENLHSLRQTLTKQPVAAICALTGLGGIGKTELALTYGHVFAWDYGLGRVFVNCENATSLTDILLSCGIAEMNGWWLPRGTREQQLAFLFNHLKANREGIIKRNMTEGNLATMGAHLLLILDNVNKLELICQENLDILPDFFHVIITTRETTSLFPHLQSEPVDRLSVDESVELLSNLRSFESAQDANAARNIAILLGGFTLAVELTGVYLARDPLVTYQSQYERLVNNHGETIQMMANKTRRLTRHIAQSVSAVMESTLSVISANTHIALEFASLMAPDAVALGWLPELCHLNDNEGINVLNELTSYSLLTPLESEPNIARIPRLVVESLDVPEEKRKTIIASIRAKCNVLLEEDEKFWYLPGNSWNIIPVYEFLKLLGKKWVVEASDKDIDWDLTRMMNSSGEILINLGKNKEAMDVYRLYHGICQKRSDAMPENVQIWFNLSLSCNKLGELENAAGKVDDARTWFDKALEINTRLAGIMPDDDDAQRGLIVSYNKFGDLEKTAGNAAAAREWYKKALIIEQQLVDKMPDDVHAQRNIGILFKNLGDLEKSVKNVSAAREWYEKALVIEQRLADSMPDNVGIQRGLSVSYERLGDLENAAGNTIAAQAWYEKTLEIGKRLADSMPENVSVQRDLSVSYEQLGNMEKSVGNIVASRKWYERSLEINMLLAQKMPEDLSVQWDLGVSYNNLGDLENVAGNADAAQAWYEKALKIEQRLADKMPDDISVHSVLKLSYCRLGDLEKAAGSAAAAREWYEKALKIDQRLADKMPDDIDAQQDLSFSYNRLGNLENAAGNAAAAREWYEKGLEIRKRLVKQAPDNIQFQWDLSISYNRLGDVEQAAGNVVTARKWYGRSFEISKRLADLMPDNVDAQRNLSFSYYRLGELENAAGNTTSARTLYEKVLEIDQRLAALIPNDVDAQRDLSISYSKFGELEYAAGNNISARKWYEKTLKINKQLADKMPENIDFQRNLSFSYERLGNMEKALGNSNAAREWFKKSMEINKLLAEKMPENLSAQMDLGVSYNNLGDLEKTAGNTAAAHICYEKALEITQWLTDLMPDNVQTQRDLSISYLKLGDLEQAAGNAAAALICYEKALKIIKRLAELMPDNVQAQNDLAEIQEKFAKLQK